MKSDRKKLVIRVFSVLLVISIMIAGLFSIFYMMDKAGAEGPTEISGVISTDTTWTVANSPYIITEKTLVEEEITLTIHPGVTIKFVNRTYLTVRGALLALGTESQMITFTSNEKSPKPGDWGKIKFEETIMNSTFNYCIIEYSWGGIEGEGSRYNLLNISITNSKFLNNRGDGIHLESANSIISGNLFFNCSTGIAANYGTYQIHHNYFIRNRNRGISSGGGGYPIKINNNIIMDNRGGIIVGGDSTLIEKNIIENNTYYGIYCSSGDPKILYNSITNNKIGIQIWGSDRTSPIVHYNNIFGNNDYSVKVVNGKSNATYNWWGTIDISVIDEKIYDYNDDWEKGKVEYLPILELPMEITLQDMPPVSELNLEQYEISDGAIDNNTNGGSKNGDESYLGFEIVFSIIMITLILGIGIYFYKRKRRNI